MIFGTNSNYMLKYQKAKAKLVEYDIPQKDYPKFPLNSNELSYPVIYILSRYAESIIENDETGKAEFAPYMVKASQYFDASVGANDRTAYDADFLLSGAAAYFLSNDFGSSKVLCAALFEKIKDMPTTGTSQIILRNLLGYLLLDKVFPISSDTFGGEELCRALLFYYTNGKGLSNIEHAIQKYRTAIYKNNDPMEIYYVDILLAVITIALSKAAWKLIPQYSKLEPGQWEEYLKSSKSPKMLWPAQQLIGKKNVLSGENAIVQLPTGVGKTKSIELIIRSSFLSNRTATAIIVAPLRALCNEVASDMTSAFGESVLINQFSDILENDFFVDFTLKATILICTPEKLSYIIHAPALEAKNISPEIDLPPHSVYLNSDYSMVERILQNLLTNAIRYSSGDIKMGLKQTRKNRAIFTIENPIDSKTEINPARLFERFYTGDASRHNSGTGVGLAVVKLLTDKLGGNVSAEIKSNVLTVTLEIH